MECEGYMVVVLYITMKEYQVLTVLGLLYSISQRTVFWLLYSISHWQSIESMECVQFLGFLLYNISNWQFRVSKVFGLLYSISQRISSEYIFWLLYDTSCKQSIECPRLLIAAPYITMTELGTVSCCTLHHTDRVTYRFLLGMIPIPSSSPSGVT